MLVGLNWHNSHSPRLPVLTAACSLIQDPQLSSLYTNRAMCRFNLRAYDGVIADCDACLAIDPDSVKAHYFKSKALLEMGADLDAACEWALSAYKACQALDSKSLQMTMTHLLRCRSERWKRRERARRREAQDLEREVLEMLERARDREVDDAQGDLERTVAKEEGDKKMSLMRDIFERARKEDDRKRDVPEWLVDDISFNVMVDPVMVSLVPLPSSFLLPGRGQVGVNDSADRNLTDTAQRTILRARVDTGCN